MNTHYKIGIMGGTFNPIHNGHITLAQKAKEYLALDQVLFMPSGVSYMKHDVLSAEHRYRMTELAIEQYPEFQISDIEFKREGNTYTVDTLELLKEKNPDNHYYFIMGADSLYAIETWHEPGRLCQLCTIVCAVRDDYTLESIKKQAEHLKDLFQADIVLLPMERIDISSTDIRNACIAGKDVSALIPHIVGDYIERYHIYG